MKVRHQADADLNADIVAGVQRRVPEIDFQTADEAELANLSDPEVLALAAGDGRILVTHDRRTMPTHFGRFIESHESPGLIVVSQKTDILSAIEDLILIWTASEAEEYVNSILTIPLLIKPRRAAGDQIFTCPATGAAPGHEDIFGSVYVNPVGHPAYVSETPTEFPEGSVIVREQISGKQPLTPELLTVMVKRARGFNPASNDWEYMVLDGAGSAALSRGKLDSCNSCHSEKKESDFVFRPPPPKLVPGRP